MSSYVLVRYAPCILMQRRLQMVLPQPTVAWRNSTEHLSASVAGSAVQHQH